MKNIDKEKLRKRTVNKCLNVLNECCQNMSDKEFRKTSELLSMKIREQRKIQFNNGKF